MKHNSKIRSEADLAWEGIFFYILAHFFRFLIDFDGFREPLGRPKESISCDFWGAKT